MAARPRNLAGAEARVSGKLDGIEGVRSFKANSTSGVTATEAPGSPKLPT